MSAQKDPSHPRKRVKFVGVKRSASDVARGETVTKEAVSPYAETILRDLGRLEAFVTANGYEREKTPPSEVWRDFVGQWLNAGLRAGSMLTMMKSFRSFHVDVYNIERTREAVRTWSVTNGLQRLADAEKKIYERELTTVPLPGVSAEPPTDAKEQERMAFWALLCETGNRAADCLRAGGIEVFEDHVRVEWGVRKVRGKTKAAYPFAWTEKPPQWILKRWTALKEKPWCFPQPETIAAAVNGWLKRWDIRNDEARITSSSPRERLDRTLRLEVNAGNISEKVYERVIDHKYETGLDHYGGGTLTEMLGA